ncbi:histone deacetylase 8 [Exaiptasia diaphana]|uniref:Histone deacetylase n=1 Tax=Exaiptasia diaphana TaxID=2652724 RepID=A0A913XZK0_EXADI|nr:histone deacetylase 8 [Exaiptasia diaphana]KXJ23746.1 Histone deacetylase 8 [Exaiptasia diaphana]
MASSDEEEGVLSTKLHKVAFIHSEDYVNICDRLPKVRGRAGLTTSLIESYGLLKDRNLSIIKPSRATDYDLLAFHSQEYIDCLKKSTEIEDDEETSQFGLGYDCPMFEDIYDCVSAIAGGTIAAAEVLKNGQASVAINWQGGWHHAQRDEAAGFCYVNDIVLGILKLREKYNRVLYVDLDLHHGDGVEDAFSFTSKVMTVSFHKYCSGFFPGSGSCLHVGRGKGRYYSLNVTYNDGITDRPFVEVFNRVMSKVRAKYKPDAIVCQCGVDTLAGDPMASFNLTQFGVGHCVKNLLSWNLPTMILGGGGYNLVNTARCWTYLTGLILGKALPNDIPEHENFLSYGPSYQLAVISGPQPDLNTRDDLQNQLKKALGNIKNIL